VVAIKNEELVNLRGGYDPNACGGGLTCYCVATYSDYSGTHYFGGYVCNQSSNDQCIDAFAALHSAADSVGCSGF
jgi:hypothetical protein